MQSYIWIGTNYNVLLAWDQLRKGFIDRIADITDHGIVTILSIRFIQKVHIDASKRPTEANRGEPAIRWFPWSILNRGRATYKTENPVWSHFDVHCSMQYWSLMVDQCNGSMHGPQHNFLSNYEVTALFPSSFAGLVLRIEIIICLLSFIELAYMH